MVGFEEGCTIYETVFPEAFFVTNLTVARITHTWGNMVLDVFEISVDGLIALFILVSEGLV